MITPSRQVAKTRRDDSSAPPWDSRAQPLAITSVFIYYLETNPAYVDLAAEVFAWVERPPNTAVTSTITMTELLVQPYRASNERRGGATAILTNDSNIAHVSGIDVELLERFI